MTEPVHSKGETGFPFSPSHIREKQRGDTGAPCKEQLARMHINDFMLQDGSPSRPRIWRRTDNGPPGLRDPAGAQCSLGRRRARGAHSGIHLQPMESFIWGTRSTPPQPRTCSEHVAIFVASGEAHLSFPSSLQVICPGTVQFVPAGTAFAFVPRSKSEGYVALIHPAATGDLQPPFPHHAMTGCSEGGITQMLDLFERARLLRRSGDDIDWRPMIGELSAILAALQPLRRLPKPQMRLDPDRRPLVERFIALASARLKSDHTIAGLASELGTTTLELERACQQTRGKRAIEIVNDIRLEKAVALLRENKLSAAQIARELGFTSLAHFTRMFVNSTGRTPENFREQFF